MADQFQAWDVQSREFGSGADFVHLATVPAGGLFVYDDGRTIPAAGYEYRLGQTTANGIIVPYNDVHLSVPGTCLWSKAIVGAAGFSGVKANAVATDPSGNVVMVGEMSGTVDFGGGSLVSGGGIDICIAKYAPDGSYLWAKRFGGIYSDTANSVVIDSNGNVIVTGYFGGAVNFGGSPLTASGLGDIFLLKLDSNGNHLWSKNFGGTSGNVSDSGQGVAIDGNGNIALVGMFSGSVDFGGGQLTSATPNAMFIARFASDGSHLWSKGFDNSGTGRTSVGMDSGGNVVVGGSFVSSINFGNGAMTTDPSLPDIFLVKFNSDGTALWSRQFGDADSQSLACLSVDRSDNIVIGGSFFGSVDFGGGSFTNRNAADIYIAKFTSSGQHVWSKQFGANSSSPLAIYGLATDSASNVVATGIMQDSLSFKGGGEWLLGTTVDVFVAKYSAPGDYIWAKRYGGGYNDYGYGISTDLNGNIFGVGTYYYSIDFGCGALTASAGSNSYLVKLSG